LRHETIRWLDAFVGRIVCFLLTIHRRVFDGLLGRSMATARVTAEAPVTSILFLKLIEQGATVLAAPAIERAIGLVGRENVYFCVFRENRPILDIIDLVLPENVFEIRHDRLSHFLVDILGALRTIRAIGIDTAINMEFLARAPAIIAYLTGARRRVGMDRFTAEGPYCGDLMTHRVQFNPYLHVSLAYLLLIEVLDENPADVPMSKVPAAREKLDPPRFVATSEEAARLRALVDRMAGQSTGRLVLLNPNTGDLIPHRLWARERFVALGARILESHPDVTIVLTGAPSERESAEEVRRAIVAAAPPDSEGDVVSLAGETTLRDVLVLYTIASVLVTNDSGPGHFATMTDIENVVLFGPETPELFGPLGKHNRVIWAQLACSPCGNPYNHRKTPCTNNVCMQVITVDQVHRVVTAALESTSARVESVAGVEA
jgi:ADP-heptose:LPS heptosyltransferase